MRYEAIDITTKVEPIVKHAGHLLLSQFRKPITWHTKADKSIVTEIDVASETLLKRELTAVIPEAAFWAEESGKQGNADYFWVIDPLDGTTNYAHGLPYFCISVALTYKNVPIWGCVYQPVLDEFFYAHKSKGAFLNGKP